MRAAGGASDHCDRVRYLEPNLNDLLNTLRLAYPRDAIPVETYGLYGRLLLDLPLDAVAAAVDDCICTSRFFPSLHDLRAAAAERMLGLPNEAAALAQVEARAAWGRDRDGDAPVVDPLVKEALEHVGGFHGYRHAEKPAVFRGQFLNLYREMRAAAIHELQVRRPAQITPGAAPLSLPTAERKVS